MIIYLNFPLPSARLALAQALTLKRKLKLKLKLKLQRPLTLTLKFKQKLLMPLLFIMKVPKPTVNSWLINVNVSLELPYIDWCQYKSNWLS